MRKLIMAGLTALVLLYSFQAYAGESRSVSFGISVMLGGRYDNMRMCVATPAGIKGGPIADILLDTRFFVNDNLSIAVNLPVMRPILFAAAFKMLQFEPEVTFEFKKNITEDIDIVYGPGLGLSFHYGPDYRSDSKDRSKSFFAMGPFISGLFGFQFAGNSGNNKLIGIRAFYVPLFSGDSDLSPGTVLGGALEGHFEFK